MKPLGKRMQMAQKLIALVLRRDRPDDEPRGTGRGGDRRAAPRERATSSLDKSTPDQASLNELRRIFENI